MSSVKKTPVRSAAHTAATIAVDTVGDIDGQIGACLRRRRQRLGVDQTDFARMLGLTAKVVGQFEGGERRIDPWTLFDMLEVLDVCVQDFFVECAPSDFLESRGGAGCRESELDVAALMRQWRTDPESIVLVQAFTSISDPKTRQNFLHLTQAISRE